MRTTATFRPFGKSGRSAATVTRRLGITPTRAGQVGDPVTSRCPDLVRDESGWWLTSTPEPEDGVELDRVVVTRLLALRGELLLDVYGDDERGVGT